MNHNKIFIADKHRLSSLDCDDAEFRAKSSEWYAPEKFDASCLYDFQVARQIDDGSKRPADWLGEDFDPIVELNGLND